MAACSMRSALLRLLTCTTTDTYHHYLLPLTTTTYYLRLLLTCRYLYASFCMYLDGQRRRNGRVWRRLARAAEGAAGIPVGRPLPGSTEPPRAARRALRRSRSRARGLPTNCQGVTLTTLMYCRANCRSSGAKATEKPSSRQPSFSLKPKECHHARGDGLPFQSARSACSFWLASTFCSCLRRKQARHIRPARAQPADLAEAGRSLRPSEARFGAGRSLRGAS